MKTRENSEEPDEKDLVELMHEMRQDARTIPDEAWAFVRQEEYEDMSDIQLEMEDNYNGLPSKSLN